MRVFLLFQSFVPLMRASGSGRIRNGGFFCFWGEGALTRGGNARQSRARYACVASAICPYGARYSRKAGAICLLCKRGALTRNEICCADEVLQRRGKNKPLLNRARSFWCVNFNALLNRARGYALDRNCGAW